MPASAKQTIVRTPGLCGGDAVIGGTRIPVWAIANARRLGLTDRQILEAYPVLTKDDLLAAAEYIENHQEEIERLIQENEEA